MTTLLGAGGIEIIILTLQPLQGSRIEVTCLKAKDGVESKPTLLWSCKLSVLNWGWQRVVKPSCRILLCTCR